MPIIFRMFRALIAHVLFTPAAIALAALGAPENSMAQNMGFTPGDAFFVFDLDEDLVNDLPQQGGTARLPYETPLIGFGGYAGFNYLCLENMTAKFVDNLRRVYRDHRKSMRKIVGVDIVEDGAKRESELNPPLHSSITAM